jgi:predicted ATP-dependent serine protease
MNDGLLYIYDGPPVISGDPQCPRCGGTEFRWEGKCVKCIVRDRESEDKWTELKIMIEEGDIKPYSKYEPKFSTDYCKGFDAALEWVESLIKELEEK